MQRYYLNWQGIYWIILNEVETEAELRENYPNLHRILSNRLDTTFKDWWKFPNIRNYDLIRDSTIKLLCPRTAARNSFSLDEKKSVFINGGVLCFFHFGPPFIRWG